MGFNPPDREWEPYDLCRPTRLSREHLHSLDLLHATFTAQLSAGVGRLSRSTTNVELVRTSQLSWDEYLRTLPAVTTLISASAPPLPGDLLVEVDTSLSLALASRLLGGPGHVEAPRRPSELELPAIRRIASVFGEALAGGLNQLIAVNVEVEAVNLSPLVLNVAAPSQMVLVLTYSLALPQLGIEGDFNLAISFSTLSPIFERLESKESELTFLGADQSLMQGVAECVPLELQATLTPTMMSAGSVAALVPGDVIVLDHRAGRPTKVSVGSVEVFRGHLGRRGSRLAIAVSSHSFDALPRARAAATGPLPGNGQHGYSQVAHEAYTVDEERQRDARDTDPSTSPVHSLR